MYNKFDQKVIQRGPCVKAVLAHVHKLKELLRKIIKDERTKGEKINYIILLQLLTETFQLLNISFYHFLELQRQCI